MAERVGAVERDVDRDALPAETLGDGRGEPPVIFSNQNPHLYPLSPRPKHDRSR
jgi:hypothetical protein